MKDYGLHPNMVIKMGVVPVSLVLLSIFVPVIIEFTRCIGTYSSVKFE